MSEYILPLIIFALIGVIVFVVEHQRKRINDIIEILLLQDTINQRLIDGLHQDAEEWVLMMRKQIHEADK